MPSTSHAVVSGGFVYTSGVLGTVGASAEVVEGGVTAETEQAFRNISAILEECGSTPEDLIRVVVYLRDMSTFLEVDEVFSRLAPGKPSRTVVYVAQLPLGAFVELEAIAEARI